MKTIAKEKVELAERLLKVIETCKELEKEEKVLNESSLLRLLADKQDQIIKLRKQIENLEYELKDWKRYSREN